jgi:hypothetical protein
LSSRALRAEVGEALANTGDDHAEHERGHGACSDAADKSE